MSVEATLRAAALNLNGAVASARRISTSDLRFKELSRKSGRLFIFAIDTSGSMALHRIKEAKGAVMDLLRQSYVHRDQVAIIGFRGDSAASYLPASRSILRARRVLDSLLVGGSTPLAAGLVCALKLAKSARGKVGEIAVVLFTDGNANVPRSRTTLDRFARHVAIEKELTRLGAVFAKLEVRVMVVDTQNSFVRTGDVKALAKRLGGQYTCLV
ncbi:MAG TPA: VWA domain-containing protein [Pyrinomonadaceae bacterium]|nr:VWA domain-containing protein [Pyrinomonadaceae bacterium]